MEVGKAVVVRVTEHLDGDYEVDLQAIGPADCERLNVVVGGQRIAVALDRGGHGMVRREFKVRVTENPHLAPSAEVVVECFYPGEQAGIHPRAVAA